MFKKVIKAVSNFWYRDNTKLAQEANIWGKVSPSGIESKVKSVCAPAKLAQSVYTPVKSIPAPLHLAVTSQRMDTETADFIDYLAGNSQDSDETTLFTVKEQDKLFGLKTDKFDERFNLALDKATLHRNLHSLSNSLDEYLVNANDSDSLNYLASELRSKAKTIDSGIKLAREYSVKEASSDFDIARKFYALAGVLEGKANSIPVERALQYA